MHSNAPIRFVAVASVAFSISLLAQPPKTPQAKTSAVVPSTLPATQTTATPEPPPIPLTPSQRPPQRAQVTNADGSLSVSADNASLNQILRQIATDTGIKITGGVADERVFGHYGPAAPAQVLATLLDGTGSNMILVRQDGANLSELILTPRQGGPTPPNPNAAAFDRSEASDPPSQAVQPTTPQGQPYIPPAIPLAPNGAAPPNSSQPDNPNGVKTPQQIYEQLQRMRQQQLQQQQAQPQQQQPPPQ